MNYPVWECYFTGGSLIVAAIAIIHVYIAHFAIGGSFFLVVTEYIGSRKQNKTLAKYVKSYTFFFMLLTMIFGSLTGVGMWFCISVVSPSATSTLLSNFVFAWAIEWIFFIGEITTLLLYWYYFDKIDQKQHIRIGIFYCIFSWLSLFTINGILSFMLTPGKWIITSSSWDGFFNPSMLPSLGFRTFFATMLAGLFGFVSAVFVTNSDIRLELINWCVKWTLLSLILSIPFLWWYLEVSSVQTEGTLTTLSPEISIAKCSLYLSIPMMLIVIIFIVINEGGRIQKIMAFTLLFIGIIYTGSFEWIRESSRRPYIISNYTYSNSILLTDVARLNTNGLLKTAKWVENRQISEHNVLEAGREIFRIQCLSCHTVGGPVNCILNHTKNFNLYGLDSQISGQGKLRGYMPEFFGTDSERMALSRFIIEKLHSKNPSPVTKLKTKKISTYPFDKTKDQYLLVGAAQYGICEVQEHELWAMDSPSNAIYAQLILRGKIPKIVSENVIVTYNIGRYSGEMLFSEELSAFYADQVQAILDSSFSICDPYPVTMITATDASSGYILAQSQFVMPASREIGCKHCHGGDWRYNNQNGISTSTAENILKTHDKISKTNFLQLTKNKGTVKCRSCHDENTTDLSEKHLNLSAAIHGFHAVYLSGKKMESQVCHTCHSTDYKGHTRSFRGVHCGTGLECTNCHGNISNLAIGLLKEELKQDKPSAKMLIKQIGENNSKGSDLVAPRKPWVNLPSCLNCHFDFKEPETDEHPVGKWIKSENSLFRRQADESGIMCISCHGSPHALYPSVNPYNENLDNISVLKYQGNTAPLGSAGNCEVCHTVDMTESIHHFSNQNTQ